MALTDAQIRAARALWMRTHPADEPAPLNKADLLAAFAALDQWVEDNQAAANQALPVVARTRLTPRQKARLLKTVITARYEVA